MPTVARVSLVWHTWTPIDCTTQRVKGRSPRGELRNPLYNKKCASSWMTKVDRTPCEIAPINIVKYNLPWYILFIIFNRFFTIVCCSTITTFFVVFYNTHVHYISAMQMYLKSFHFVIMQFWVKVLYKYSVCKYNGWTNWDAKYYKIILASLL